MKVVVIDDSLQVQKSFGAMLSALPGVELAGCARDAVGAMSLVDATHPDVVVLDVNLLDDDKGIDVLHYVRRQHPKATVVALSNFVSPRLRQTYLDAGASAYFDKSTEFTQARDWIARLSHSR
jgi:DNA-binding NarL/FixJ family response regulator